MTQRISRPDKRCQLNLDEVRLIRLLFKQGIFKQKQLAKLYNVATQTINDIICQRTWKNKI